MTLSLFGKTKNSKHFKVKIKEVFEDSASHASKPWLVREYVPGCINHLSFGGWSGKKLIGIWFLAKKKIDSTHEKIPNQSIYIKRWGKDNDEKGYDTNPSNLRFIPATKLKNKLKNKLKKLMISNQ